MFSQIYGFFKYALMIPSNLAVGSEAETVDFYFFHLFRFGRGDVLVFFIGYNDDGAPGIHRTNGFAASATDAQLRLYVRNGERSFVGNHVYGLRGAVFGAGSAVGAFGVDDAAVDMECGDANLNGALFFPRQCTYGVHGAYFSANRTFIVAIAVFESAVRTQHIVKPKLQSGRP
jgi:hypothetical protein